VTVDATIFLLSPAKLSGRRGKMIMNPEASFALARYLRSAEGAPLGEVFSFVSGLYFRGKVSYARTFGRGPAGLRSAHVITAGGGLYGVEDAVSLERLRDWQAVSVSEQNPHFTAPLVRQACALLDSHDASARFVLLGSIASDKYVSPLLEVFGERLLFPARFAGLGDMGRGSLMLRAARDGQELDYLPVAGARASFC
jgi:hypothetical protein